MRQLSPRTYLLIGGAVAGALLGSDLLQLLKTGRLPAGQLRQAALAAAALLTAVGLSNRHTHQHTYHTLELARRLERARTTGVGDGQVVPFPAAVRPR